MLVLPLIDFFSLFPPSPFFPFFLPLSYFPPKLNYIFIGKNKYIHHLCIGERQDGEGAGSDPAGPRALQHDWALRRAEEQLLSHEGPWGLHQVKSSVFF